MELTQEEHDSFLSHYGTPRHSGRYPWGSGDNPYQRNASFRSHVQDLKKQGMSEVEIARGMGMTTGELRAKLANARAENRAADVSQAQRLKEKGYSNVAIGKRMGINESTVRSLLNETIQDRADRAANTATILENALKEKRFIDVGLGTEGYLGVSKYTLDNSLALLKEKGYNVYSIKVDQLGTNKQTTMQVLAPPDATWADVMKNKGDIQLVTSAYSDEGEKSVLGLQKPVSIDSKRVMVRYADDKGADGGKGIDKDGVIELRRGVDDISLGSANYAQVRIAVNGTHYLKGMAIYSDDMPDGVDIIFNTNKHKGTPMMGPKDNTVLKPLKKTKEGDIDWDNPFGATIKPEDTLTMAQRYYTDKNGKKKLSAINIVNEEGDWEKWAPTLSSQFLSKQTPTLAKKQLKLVSDAKQAEFDEIMSLTNPTVKKKLLMEFADECDSAAVHLKAAALPRQSSHVILPVPGLKETEIYAPNYRNGEEVALVRHPHGGRFEIPTLKVNNNVKAAENVIGKNSPDAVGINAKVAARLSGADFDGDSVLVIPTRGTGIKTSPSLDGLKDFEPKETYRAYPGMPAVGPKTGFQKQRQMGDISNLITDMTIKGAPDDEICRAVRHSMVVIDAEKHNLNWRQSFEDNGIADLKRQYQGRADAGASTLISKAKSPIRVDERKEISPDKRTGERRYIDTGRTYTKIVGKKNPVEKEFKYQSEVPKMAYAKDAHSLSSGTIIEGIYADHANKLKSLANVARKEAISTKSIPYSSSARQAYSKEVAELDAAYKQVLKNKPLERQAQLIANTVVESKKNANPELRSKENRDDLKKIKYQALREARERTGAKKSDIMITDKQWEAIQAGAIHKTRLEDILNSSDSDRVKELALPKTQRKVSESTIARVKAMRSNGATQAEIADTLGLSSTTVNTILRS